MPILLGMPSACCTTWIECILFRAFTEGQRPQEVVSPSKVMVFHFPSGRASRAEGAGRDGSGKLVLLSSLLTVRRLWAGTPRGIKLGQQLASCEQTQVLTGCCPAHNYQYSVQSTLRSFCSVSLLLPVPPPSPWLSLQEQPLGLPLWGGQNRRTMALQTEHLVSHWDTGDPVPTGDFHRTES